MKKRTKNKINGFISKIFQFILKLIFIYPFKLLWFLIKNLYLLIKKEIQQYLEKRRIAKQEDKIHHLKENARFKKGVNKIIISEKKNKNLNEEIFNEDDIPLNYEPFLEVKNYVGSLNDFEKKMYTHKSTIGLILGARGTGKSALGMRILENFMVQSDKKLYAMGFKQKDIPSWIISIENISEIENNSTVLIDESGIEFSSRKAMTNANKLLSEILLIARHKDLSVIFITQNSSNLEINVIRQADYILLKPSSLLQKDFERQKIKDIYEEIAKDFEKLKNHIGLTYIYADTYRGFVTNTLPSFWNEKVSKAYAHKK